jgi:hypothetical protein
MLSNNFTPDHAQQNLLPAEAWKFSSGALSLYVTSMGKHTRGEGAIRIKDMAGPPMYGGQKGDNWGSYMLTGGV